jgi:hypothetical protein
MINVFNKIDFNYYNKFIDECENQITKKEIIKEKPLTKEEKEKNYRELVLAQMKYDREQAINNLLSKNGNYSAYRKENFEYSERISSNKQYSYFNETKKLQKILEIKIKKIIIIELFLLIIINYLLMGDQKVFLTIIIIQIYSIIHTDINYSYKMLL